MEITTIIHDENIVVDPITVDFVKKSMQKHAMGTHRPFKDGEMGLLLVLIGASLIDWESM
jgi:hypothetical protein